MPTLQEQLDSHGLTFDQARDFFYANYTTPSLVFEAAKSLGLTSDMVGEVAGYSGGLARQWLDVAHLDYRQLDGPQGTSDYVFLTDFVDGDVFLYNPFTQSGRKIHSFGVAITDIAVDDAGNVYACDFGHVYKYSIATGAFSTIVNVPAAINSLTVNGNSLFTATGADGTLARYDKETGALLGQSDMGGGGSAGDIAFIGDVLYRLTTSNGLVDQTHGYRLPTEIDLTFWGLSVSAFDHLLAFNADGRVVEVNPATNWSKEWADIEIAGLNQLSGAAAALNLHVEMFL